MINKYTVYSYAHKKDGTSGAYSGILCFIFRNHSFAYADTELLQKEGI